MLTTMGANPYRKQTGRLIQVLPSGSSIVLLDKRPWAELSKEKNTRIAARPDLYNTDNLKVTNL